MLAHSTNLDVADAAFLRHTFKLARRARDAGNHPFAAILVDPTSAILIEMENGFLPHGDMTAHAERLLATQASRTLARSLLAQCSLYSSAEPCAMCAGAIYWSGIGRIVYGLAERRLAALTGDHDQNPTLDLPCRAVFSAGRRHIEVRGPLLEEEAAAVHAGAWTGWNEPDNGRQP